MYICNTIAYINFSLHEVHRLAPFYSLGHLSSACSHSSVSSESPRRDPPSQSTIRWGMVGKAGDMGDKARSLAMVASMGVSLARVLQSFDNLPRRFLDAHGSNKAARVYVGARGNFSPPLFHYSQVVVKAPSRRLCKSIFRSGARVCAKKKLPQHQRIRKSNW